MGGQHGAMGKLSLRNFFVSAKHKVRHSHTPLYIPSTLLLHCMPSSLQLLCPFFYLLNHIIFHSMKDGQPQRSTESFCVLCICCQPGQSFFFQY